MKDAMIQRFLMIATLVTGAGIGFLWPSKKAVPPLAASEIALDKSPDGQFYADVRVNGQPTHFLVDTGSSEIALSEDDARRAGIEVDPSSYELIGDGASGIVRGTQVEIHEIDLDGFQAKDIKAVVVPGTKVSLLGQPFLDRLDEIVIRKDEMHLRYSANS
jgi:aspartyl protease family protein